MSTGLGEAQVYIIRQPQAQVAGLEVVLFVGMEQQVGQPAEVLARITAESRTGSSV